VADSKPQTSRPNSSPFQDLKKQARRLERVLFILVGVIAVLPTTFYLILGFAYLQSDARRAVEQVRFLLVEIHGPNPERRGLSGLMQKEMQLNGISSLRLMGTSGRTILSLGEPVDSFLNIRVESALPLSLAPFTSIAVGMDSHSLLARAARVFGIHLVVAAFLMFLLHRFYIPALEKAIEQLETTQAQLIHSEKMGGIGEIFAGLTHEINNPLGIIIGKLELVLKMAKQLSLPSSLSHDLEIIYRNGLRIAELIRSLLVFSRKNEFNFMPTALNDVIYDVVELVDKPYARQGIRIETLFDPKLPPCDGSRGHLQQVFLNLLNNARDAMPRGGTITIRTYVSDQLLTAEVKDDGVGMDVETKSRLFEPFYTTKGVGKGTGLGLSVAYGIIKTHGGHIEVKSEPGRGTLFRVTLPMEGPAQ
jgi:signal transduction histidine kinase